MVQSAVCKVSEAVRGSHITDAGGDEGAIGLERKMGIALVGVERPGLLLLYTIDDRSPCCDGVAGISDPGIGHMRFEQQVGDDVTPKGAN